MTTTARDDEAVQLQSSAAASVRRDTLVALAGLWLLGGLYLDGWAHVHVPALETFFSPWHAVLYGGFLLLAVSIVTPALLGWRQGLGWRAATPVGYGLAMLGVALFGAGGLLDMGWHSLFGIESDTEALISPPHLLLATGAGLMVSTPLRSAWRRGDAPQHWATWLPPLLSLVLLLALLGFFTSYAHPFAQTAAARSERYTVVDQAMASVLLQAGVLSGAVLLLVRRWGSRWPLGSLTLALPLALAPLTLMFDRFLVTGPLPLIAVAGLAGLVGDALLRLLRPSVERLGAARLFAALLPAILYALYLAAIAASAGLWWSAHLTFGAVTLAALAGWLVSYLVFAPTFEA